MSYVLAIDVGTSFTAAAVARFDQGTSSSPECLPLGIRGTSVPSVLFYPEEGPILVGEAAERRGLDFPARVVREFKRRVGDAVPISVGTLSLPAEDVFATMARWVADRAEEREGAPPSEIILTHPAAWGSHRTSLLKEALAARNLQDVALVTEPEAAALHYASQVRVEEGSTIAVYDLGGGTFDTAVLRKAGSNRFDLLGRPEGIENLGGADFDAAVLRYVAGNTGGALSSLDTSDPGARAALARLQRECVEAKEALSSDSEASISVLLPGFQQQVRLVRSEFEALIDEPIRDTVYALEQSLADLKLAPAELSAVLLIGGSSRIPLVAQVVSEQLDRPIAVDADPKSSICLGAAAAAVLAREAAAAEIAAQAAAEAGPAAALDDAAPGHAPGRPASWSRKSTTAAGAMAGAAGQGAAHGQHGHRGGAHAPKPTVRLTAIAAAAAAFTVLSATAAQSPEGLSSLTSIFTPKADAAPEKGPSAGGSGGGGTGGAAAAGAGAEAQEPARGIEASASTKDSAPGTVGLEVAASPTSRPTTSADGELAAAGSGVMGALDTATGTTAAPGAGAGGVTEPLAAPAAPAGSTDPVAGTSEPVPGEPGTGSPVPVDPPATEEPPPPVTEEPPPPVTEEPPPATEEPTPLVTEEPPPPVTEEPPPPVTEEPSPPAPEPTASMATESAPATDPATAAEPAV